MTAFDTQINVTHFEVGVNDDNDRLVVNLVVGQELPFATPGTNQPITAPVAKLSFPLDRASALEIGKQLTDEGQKLKEPSRLEIASDIEQAEAESKLMEGIRGFKD